MFLILILLRNPAGFLRAMAIAAAGWGAYGRYMQSPVVGEAISHSLMLREARGIGARYSMFQNVAGVELYRASREYALRGNTGVNVWRKLLGPVTPDEGNLWPLAAVINKLTGTFSIRALGVSQGQEALERMLIFPHYVRCYIGLLADAMHGGIRGNEGRRLMANLAAIAMEIYFIVTSI